tara:strand:+ start:559 stop:1107 length:549 start_codon:yes stop_codon:yes gene_type:complete
MIKFTKYLAITALLINLSACFDSEKNEEKTEQIIKETPKTTEEYLDIEVVSVNDFNKHPPFFSNLSTSPVEWKTITQANNTEKIFQFKASTIFAVNDEIIKSTIVDDQVIINHGIHTGMPRDRFEAHFDDLIANESPSDSNPIIRLSPSEVYISCCTEETQYWKFKFDNDTLYEVIYHQYYD